MTSPFRSSALPTSWSSTVRWPTTWRTTSRGSCSRRRRSWRPFIPRRRNSRSSRAAAGSPADYHPGCAPLLRRETPVAVASEALEPFQEPTGRTLQGRSRLVATALAIGLSLYSLYWVLFIVQPQIYRVSFLLVALVLIFLRFPWRADESSPRVTSDRLALIAAQSSRWRGRFSISRASSTAPPIHRESMSCSGVVTILLVLEATRRSVGWILPATAVAFIAYGWGGPFFDRIGLSLDRTSRLRDRSARRHALHDARGDLRRAARCRRRPTSSSSRSTAPCSSTPAPAASSSTGRWRRSAVRDPVRRPGGR